MPLTEDQVKNAVIVELGRMHYLPNKIKTESEHGVDITAKHSKYARYFLVEVKGDPAKSVKNPNSYRENNFLLCVGQLMTRIYPERGYHYGLAFPATYKTKLTRRLPYSLLKKLKIQLFFVDTKRKVERLSWKEVAKIQKLI